MLTIPPRTFGMTKGQGSRLFLCACCTKCLLGRP
nr:MAG TPA: hypothetical protein [Microviridae sp.]